MQTLKKNDDGLLDRAFLTGFWILSALRKRVAPHTSARAYSNNLLRQYLKSLGGDIINVSGWMDCDREGGRYADYYGTVRSYTISNIGGHRGMPTAKDPTKSWLFLNLEAPLPCEFQQKYDAVFCHTVLEHVFETKLALTNIATLSRDIVILVVPFSQSVHYSESYSNYVRLSPYYLDRFFREEGFSTLMCDANDEPFTTVYVTFIASRYPNRHPEFACAVRYFEVSIGVGTWGRRKGVGLGNA
jgi:hypothetical protein